MRIPSPGFFKCTFIRSNIFPYLFKAPAETLKNPFHVPSFLHRDDPGVIFFIYPNKEGLLIVVPVDPDRNCLV